MSLLVLQLPPRGRLGSRAAVIDAEPGLRVPTEWSFVFSADGRAVTQAGQAAVAQLPRATQCVLVLAEADVSWHRVDIPRAPAARLRAALAGVMEEALLDDDTALHFALGPDAAPGRSGWVAVTDARRLGAALAALEAAGLTVERVVPGAAPVAAGAAGRGHFFSARAGEGAPPWLSLARSDGLLCLRLSGALARTLLPGEAAAELRWSATPAAAQAAEAWLGGPVPLMGEAERALEAAQGHINLRQFELASRHRGTRALREGVRRLFSAEWRAVRLGLVALLVLQLVGLNAFAWQQRQHIAAKRQAMNELLKLAHPGVRVVLDAPVQMQRETDRLRAAAGRVGAADLEALLSAAAAAWPDGATPTPTLRFETGKLTLAVPDWAEAQVQQFSERLRGAGYVAEFAEGRAVLSRAVTRGAL